MKIHLPSPKEFLDREDMWFEQLDLAIYHAKKAWAQIKKTYPDKEGDQPWIDFRLHPDIIAKLDDIDPDYETRHEIEIEIVEP